MDSQAVNSQGTLLKIGDGGAVEVFTTIAEVKDIDGPGFSKDTEDVTNHSSLNGFRENKATLKSIGDLSFDLNWFGDDTHGPDGGLWAAFLSEDPTNFQIVYPTEPVETLSFAANVTEYSIEAPVEGVLTASLTLEGTGAPTWS